MKKKYLIIIVVVTLLALIPLTHETSTVFDKLAKTEIKTQEYNFGKTTHNDTVNYTFIIKNISDNSFIITKVLPSCTCTVVNSNIRKIYQKNEIAKIETQYIPKKSQSGIVENLILVECNSEEGIIKLNLKGQIISK